MAFVFRAPRFHNPGGNPATGPGSYNIARSTWIRSSPRMAPFNSTSARLQGDSHGLDVPGPGSYLPVFEQNASKRKAATSAFASTSARFRDRSNANEPVSCLVHRDWTTMKNQRNVKSMVIRRQPAVKWVRASTAPSIPARCQSHGYLQNERGDLESRSAPVEERTGVGQDVAGPGDYNVDDTALRVIRTCDFGRTKSKRSTLPTRTETPLSHLAHKQWIDPDNVRPSMAFASTTNRFPDEDIERKSLPAPGQYDPWPIMRPETRLPKSKQVFSRSSERMSISRNDIPGVGSYDIQPQSSFKTASDVKLRRATLGIKHSPPFQNTEQRFGTISRQEVPGPGSYDPDRRNVIDPELEEYKKSKRTGFGVGSERFAAPKQNSTPSPGSYVANPFPEPRYKAGRASAAFQSHARRFQIKEGDSAVSPPISYSTISEWRPKKRIGNAPGVFVTGAERFRDTNPKQALPGPGAYLKQELPPPRPAAVSAFRSGSKRFGNEKGNGIPGPGTYDLAHDDAMVKRSFNITIGDEYQ